MASEQVIIFIIGTVVILFGAYYVTYYIGMKASGQTRAGLRNRNIRLVDRYAISRDKQFCVIEIAGKVYIVGMTNQSMTLLDTLDAAAFAMLTEKTNENVPWSETPVGMYGNKLTKMVVSFIASKTGRKPPANGAAEKDSPGVSPLDSDNHSHESRFETTLEKAKRKTTEPEQPEDTQEDPPEED